MIKLLVNKVFLIFKTDYKRNMKAFNVETNLIQKRNTIEFIKKIEFYVICKDQYTKNNEW